mgnify:CR=1 FL=1
MKGNILNLGVFFLGVALLMSCSKCDVNSIEHPEKQYSVLLVKLDSLDNPYSIEYDKSNRGEISPGRKGILFFPREEGL